MVGVVLVDVWPAPAAARVNEHASHRAWWCKCKAPAMLAGSASGSNQKSMPTLFAEKLKLCSSAVEGFSRGRHKEISVIMYVTGHLQSMLRGMATASRH